MSSIPSPYKDPLSRPHFHAQTPARHLQKKPNHTWNYRGCIPKFTAQLYNDHMLKNDHRWALSTCMITDHRPWATKWALSTHMITDHRPRATKWAPTPLTSNHHSHPTNLCSPDIWECSTRAHSCCWPKLHDVQVWVHTRPWALLSSLLCSRIWYTNGRRSDLGIHEWLYHAHELIIFVGNTKMPILSIFYPNCHKRNH